MWQSRRSIDRSPSASRIEMRRTRGNPLKCLIVSIWVNSKVSSSASSWWLSLICGSTGCFTRFRSDFFRLCALDTGRWGTAIVEVDATYRGVNDHNRFEKTVIYGLRCGGGIWYCRLGLFDQLTERNVIDEKVFIAMIFLPLLKSSETGPFSFR